MTDPTARDLIRRLAEALPIRWNMGDSDLLLLNEARAYLAAPDEPAVPDGREPASVAEQPTDAELQELKSLAGDYLAQAEPEGQQMRS